MYRVAWAVARATRAAVARNFADAKLGARHPPPSRRANCRTLCAAGRPRRAGRASVRRRHARSVHESRRPGALRPEPRVATVSDERPKHSVLVVDDESAVREVTAQLLEACGFVTAEAADGSSALEVAGGLHRLDAVVLDLTMPGPSAGETLRALRAERPEVAVLFTSGFTERAQLEPLLAQPRTAFLHKPYETHELVAALEQLLSR